MEILGQRKRRECGKGKGFWSAEGAVGKYTFLLILSVYLTGVLCEENDGIPLEKNSLMIVPSSKNRVYQRALGKASVFTCTANVEDPERLTEFRWWWPDGKRIEAAANGVEIMWDHTGPSLTLLFTSIQQRDLGTYKCTATYGTKHHMSTDFTLRAFVPITFEDAPINQYAVKGRDYRVRCQVRADPEPQVDWKKDHRVINNSDHFLMDKDGVLIRGVTEADEGVYTCRVRVTSMGTVEERHIQVEVQEHPKLTSESEELEGVEEESVTFQCGAVGKPDPEYEWVNHRHQDLRHLERHTVDKYKGTLTIQDIKSEDVGVYTCTARNNAGYVTMKSTLDVITKPEIEHFKNITTQVNGNLLMICRASGDPAPDIRFHKDGLREPFSMGSQNDARIIVDQRKNGRNTVATLKISDVLRTDDGLYSCIAYNERTKSELSGHITVEFPPTFVNSPMRETWSWDGRAVNVTCMAEAIPNATISWFIEGSPERSVGSSIPGVKQIGVQSQSSLEIKPENRSLFGFYKCVATNKLGTAEHRVELKEARKPGPILEAIVHEKTATSITYKIVGPRDDGGLPVKHFVAQFKEDGATWEDHGLKRWPVAQQLCTIDGLQPLRKYFVRFAAESEVGLGKWALEKQETTPRKSAPEVAQIMNAVNGVAITAYPDKFELIWKVPPDNGERIKQFEIGYQPVRNMTVMKASQVENLWEPFGEKLVQVKSLGGEPRLMLKNLAPGTHYKVELRARNKIGASGPAEIIIKTAPMPGGSYEVIKGESMTPTSVTWSAESFPLIIFIVSVLAALVILILLDITCCRINEAGIIWVISRKMCNRKKSRESLVKDATIHETRPLKKEESTCVTVEGSPTTDESTLNYDQISGTTNVANGNSTSAPVTTTNSIMIPQQPNQNHHQPPKNSDV